MKRIEKILKRLFDLLFSAILLAAAAPFLLAAALWIKICSPEGPVLFRQTRIGYHGKPFTIWKLRTMTDESDPVTGALLPDAMRLKKWGKILRKTNLDELPQIIHIFRGEMSLIGPRPLLPREMEIMSAEEQEMRQSVPPGITGWEAVNERKTVTRREMAMLDLYYVGHWSLRMDLKIFLLTIFILFTGRRPDDRVRAPEIEKELKKR